ncbi:hypothetical protein I7I51_05815 [Histoplasma capsulatum]|uniref:PH domain-containing protein n=1 Tax=Ajellomyces capsulatus TaxID=5037 RepID=A0A8A1M3I3_AJECA|nr:hypothetical protein I7I51_05815 [Histoplasma capsulatum]
MDNIIIALRTSQMLRRWLEALDKALGGNELIYAFSPITMISPAGYLAVSYFRNRAMTEDIDAIIDPEYASDEELLRMMHTVMVEVGRDLNFGEHWINDSVALLLTQPARKSLFSDAEKQNIVLWSVGLGDKSPASLRQAPTSQNFTDTEDVMVILNTLINQNNGPLERDAIQRLNRNGLDIVIADRVLDQVAEVYGKRYGNSPFAKTKN